MKHCQTPVPCQCFKVSAVSPYQEALSAACWYMSGWLSKYCQDVICVCAPADWRKMLFVLTWQYMTLSIPFLCESTVHTSHLFKSAHLDCFLAPNAFPDCSCDDGFKVHPISQWDEVSLAVSRVRWLRGYYTHNQNSKMIILWILLCFNHFIMFLFFLMSLDIACWCNAQHDKLWCGSLILLYSFRFFGLLIFNFLCYTCLFSSQPDSNQWVE